METQPGASRRRVRPRSIATQLQAVLDDAQGAMTAETSTQKLVQVRLESLMKLQARDRQDKFRKVTDQLKSAHAEIERLKQENERMKQELDARPTAKTVPTVTTVEEALRRYEATKGAKQCSSPSSI